MECEEFEIAILEYLEGDLPSAEHRAIERHLAHCAACASFARQLRQLDDTLVRSVKTPNLSSSFNSRLAEQILAAQVMSKADRAERKRLCQEEFETKQVELRKQLFNFNGLFESIRVPLLIGLAGGLFLKTAPLILVWTPLHDFGGLDPRLSCSLIASAVFLVAGYSMVYQCQSRIP